jgi:hypothetical protein
MSPIVKIIFFRGRRQLSRPRQGGNIRFPAKFSYRPTGFSDYNQGGANPAQTCQLVTQFQAMGRRSRGHASVRRSEPVIFLMRGAA